MEDVSKIKQRGITLIALVITIIVLLILAGVTINLTIGERGIFTTAQRAAKNYTSAQEKELAGIDNFEYTLDDTIAEINGQTVLNGSYSEKNKVNSPNLSHTGLTPIKFSEVVATSELEDGDNDEIIKDVSSEEIQKESWYDYGSKQWANAQSADGSLWVWIPRFAYKITINSGEGAGKIDIVFLKGTTDEPADGSSVTIKRATEEEIADSDYIVHPAFCDGSKEGYPNGEWDAEIPGFWMAKFEAGYAGKLNDPNSAQNSEVKYKNPPDLNFYQESDITTSTKIKYPEFKANRPSFNNISIGDCYLLCRELTANDNPYGFTSKIDSHLIKNSEWGAVAYLAWSKYGIGHDLNPNLVCGSEIYAVTGYGVERTGPTKMSKDLSELINGVSSNDWTSDVGQGASTTENISGIYDMSSGLLDRVAGYRKGNNCELYGGDMVKTTESTKYVNVYDKDYDGYASEENKRLGEAIWETSTSGTGSTAWMWDNSGFPTVSEPFMGRGGTYDSGSYGGIFAFRDVDGSTIEGNKWAGFRAVLVVSN